MISVVDSALLEVEMEEDDEEIIIIGTKVATNGSNEGSDISEDRILGTSDNDKKIETDNGNTSQRVEVSVLKEELREEVSIPRIPSGILDSLVGLNLFKPKEPESVPDLTEDASWEDLAGVRRSGRSRKPVIPTNYRRSESSDDEEEGNLRHDAMGRLNLDGVLVDLCDCLRRECPGCHFPCKNCSSQKCGFECRRNRRYCYTQVQTDGSSEKRVLA